MMRIYNVLVSVAEAVLRLFRHLPSCGRIAKERLFADCQRGMIERIENEMSADNDRRPVVWFHAASLGEFAVARPVMQKIGKQGAMRIVLTFFSPTGYNALKDNHEGIDHLFLLPLDTDSNVRRFIRAVKPAKAVLIISECWFNYLRALRENGIPAYLVSALITERSPLIKWWGGMFRCAYKAYTHIFVLDLASKQRLNGLGFNNVSVSGDPLFDNANSIAHTPWSDKTVERFCGNRKVFVAGSISDDNDLRLVAGLANRHRDIRFIFVPHEISEESLNMIKYELDGHALFYSECDDKTDFTTVQVLVIDFLGALAYLYRYATWTYIGGGFTPLLHSVIEATVYGVPVAFGPMTHRKVTPSQLISLGIGCKVANLTQLDAWFKSLKDNDSRLDEIRLTAAKYVADNLNATQRIAEMIMKDDDDVHGDD